MSHKMTASADQCMQFYQQPFMDGMTPIEGFMDATMSSEAILSPSNSHSGHQLTPKGGAFKPIRRRSRASKRTPTTLLKANTSNFRALVQQFTGCPTTTPMSLAIHKGPITLNFQQQIQHHTTTAMPLSGQKLQPQQQLMQEQQSGYCLPTSGNSSLMPISCMDVSDGLLFDNDFSLHELTVNAVSNDFDDFFMK